MRGASTVRVNAMARDYSSFWMRLPRSSRLKFAVSKTIGRKRIDGVTAGSSEQVIKSLVSITCGEHPGSAEEPNVGRAFAQSKPETFTPSPYTTADSRRVSCEACHRQVGSRI